ncbi:MAG: response regulator transcription factor [Opitutaceae bacterium]|nr:response regulator transcription factor [Opitutaceae bacterium]
MSPVTVAIVEDNAAICASLEQMINMSDRCRCLSVSRNGEHALRAILKHQPDVVIMDINLPDMTGIECISRLKSQLPKTQFLVLTVYNDSRQIFKALEAGASGYLLKRSPPEAIIQGVCDVHAGGSPMSAEIARKVVQSFQRTTEPENEIAALTSRELEILQQVTEGLATKEIAERLGVSYTTICTHLGHIYEKLHVHSRTAAAAKYLQAEKR